MAKETVVERLAERNHLHGLEAKALKLRRAVEKWIRLRDA